MTVVLLHAFPLDGRMWDAQREALARDDIVAPRLYGRGSSLDSWAEQLLAELPGELVLVGASMGGYCALAMLRRAPERVPALALVGSRAGADSPERRAFRDELVEQLRRDGPLPDAAPGVTTEELADATLALRDRDDSTEVLAAFAGSLLVCVGAQDDIVPVEEARALAGLVPAGRLEVFEGAGHLPSLDRPERFNRVLEEFLAPWT